MHIGEFIVNINVPFYVLHVLVGKYLFRTEDDKNIYVQDNLLSTNQNSYNIKSNKNVEKFLVNNLDSCNASTTGCRTPAYHSFGNASIWLRIKSFVFNLKK